MVVNLKWRSPCHHRVGRRGLREINNPLAAGDVGINRSVRENAAAGDLLACAYNAGGDFPDRQCPVTLGQRRARGYSIWSLPDIVNPNTARRAAHLGDDVWRKPTDASQNPADRDCAR